MNAAPAAKRADEEGCDVGRARDVARLDIAHRGEQHRVESDASTEAEHMLGSTATPKLPSTGARAKSRARAPPRQGGREWDPDAEAHDEPRHRHEVARQEGEPDLERAVAQDELKVEGPRGRTRRTSPRPIRRRRRRRSRRSAGGRARAARAASRCVLCRGNGAPRAHPAGAGRKSPAAPANPRLIPAQPASAKTGLSRRRSRVRVASLPLFRSKSGAPPAHHDDFDRIAS
jgi:hypothetical protein